MSKSKLNFGTGAPKCAVCVKSVYEQEKINAVGQVWHKDCFTCGGMNENKGGCKKKLGLDTYLDHAGNPYCKPCHGKLFGPKGFGFGISAANLSSYEAPTTVAVAVTTAASTTVTESMELVHENLPVEDVVVIAEPSITEESTVVNEIVTEIQSVAVSTDGMSEESVCTTEESVVVIEELTFADEPTVLEEAALNMPAVVETAAALDETMHSKDATETTVEGFEIEDEVFFEEALDINVVEEAVITNEAIIGEVTVDESAIINLPAADETVDDNITQETVAEEAAVDEPVTADKTEPVDDHGVATDEAVEAVRGLLTQLVHSSSNESETPMFTARQDSLNTSRSDAPSTGRMEAILTARSEMSTSRGLANRIKFGEGAPKCASCTKSVYPAEKVQANSQVWHKGCFTCGGTESDGCKKKLGLDSYLEHVGNPYCKPCHGKVSSIKNQTHSTPVVSIPNTHDSVTTQKLTLLSETIAEEAGPESPMPEVSVKPLSQSSTVAMSPFNSRQQDVSSAAAHSPKRGSVSSSPFVSRERLSSRLVPELNVTPKRGSFLNKPLSSSPFVSRDREVAPMIPEANNSTTPKRSSVTKIFGEGAPKCASCTKSVYAAEKVQANDQVWHKGCFTCGGTESNGCKKKLGLDSYLDHASNPYCKPCHRKLFGPKGYGFSTSVATVTSSTVN